MKDGLYPLKETRGSIHAKLDEILAVLHSPLFRYETLFIRFGKHAWKRDIHSAIEKYDCPLCKTTLSFTSNLSYSIEQPSGSPSMTWELCV